MGLLPGLYGEMWLAGCSVGVAEVAEANGFVGAGIDLPEQCQCLVIAGDCLGVLAEVALGVGETVPGVGFVVAVAEFLVQADRLRAVIERLFVFSEAGVVPAEVVQGGSPDTGTGKAIALEALRARATGPRAIPWPLRIAVDDEEGTPEPRRSADRPQPQRGPV
jgi:hypothetical protein